VHARFPISYVRAQGGLLKLEELVGTVRVSCASFPSRKVKR
jgi:hypothetical protein